MATRSKDPSEVVGAAAVAPPRTRRYRAVAFQAYLLGASVVFIVLAVLARTHAYFPIDLTISRALQRVDHPLFAALMYVPSWLGFLPQIAMLGTGVVLVFYFLGLRREGEGLLFAAVGAGICTLVKLIVYRPRPTADLVNVLNQLSSPSFPSGHVMVFTTFCGFLFFLAFTLLKVSWVRTTLLSALGLLIGLMGPSRIYLGQHWFSDVMGAYVLGSLWLVLTIRFYQWRGANTKRSSA